MARYVSSHTGAQIDAAVSNAHTHSNKAILDSIPSTGSTGYVLTKTATGTAWAQGGGGGGGSVSGLSHVQFGTTGVLTVAASGSISSAQTVTLTGFSNAPVVSLTVFDSENQTNVGRVYAVLKTVSASSFTFQCRNEGSSARSVKVQWLAVE